MWGEDVCISFAAIEEDGEDQEGDKYILIDAGGGTVDIVVHEILQCKSVKEVFHPSGGIIFLFIILRII